MSRPRPTDPIGSIGWTERTGGVLTTRDCLTLARPLLRAELGILAGRLAMLLRMHSGRRSSIDPASLVPPDSLLARDAGVAAQDLLTPVLLNHSSRAYTWGAAIAALHGITFDRELLYLAAMFHDTGIPSPVPDVDFTVRSAAVARAFTDSHGVPADSRELVANAIAMHYTPGVGLDSGAEAYLLAAGAGVDVFGLRSNEIPDAVRRRVIQQYPRLGFKREFARLLRAEAKQVPRGRAWYLHRFAVSDVSIRLAPFRGWCVGNVVDQAAASASCMDAANASGPCSAAAGSIHMTCQPWPSRSKKLREYMKPWSSASSASVPPASSAAALTVSTSSRDDALKQYSASACVVGSAIGSFENSADGGFESWPASPPSTRDPHPDRRRSSARPRRLPLDPRGPGR